MFDEIEWRAAKGSSKEIEGFCPELPDSYSRFVIQQTEDRRCWVILPTLADVSTTNRIILDTRPEAQKFCVTFLKDNMQEVIRHQIRKMKNVYNLKTEKPIKYYENLLQDLINQEALIRVRKSIKTKETSGSNFPISTNDDFDLMK